MIFGAETIPLLAVAASLVVPLVTESLKKRFGREETAGRQSHERHAELMAELSDCRAAQEKAETSEARWQEECQRMREREIALLRELAGKDMLLSQLSDNLPGLLRKRTAKQTGSGKRKGNEDGEN